MNNKYFDGFDFVVSYTTIDKDGKEVPQKPHVITSTEGEDSVDSVKSLLLELHCLNDVDHRSIEVKPLVPLHAAMDQFNRVSKLYKDSLNNKEGDLDIMYLLLAMKQMIENLIFQTVGDRENPISHYHQIPEPEKMKLDELLYNECERNDIVQQLLMDV